MGENGLGLQRDHIDNGQGAVPDLEADVPTGKGHSIHTLRRPLVGGAGVMGQDAKQRLLPAVSYTHLDVYKRQQKSS